MYLSAELPAEPRANMCIIKNHRGPERRLMVPQIDRNTETGATALETGRAASGRNPELLRSSEAAFYIDMSDSWLRQTRMMGRTDGPPFLRQGRAIRYRRCDLDRWLECRLCGGTEQTALPPVPASPPKRQRKLPQRGKGGNGRVGR